MSDHKRASKVLFLIAWSCFFVWWTVSGISFDPFSKNPFSDMLVPVKITNFGGELGVFFATYGLVYYGLAYYLIPMFPLIILRTEKLKFSLTLSLSIFILSLLWLSAIFGEINYKGIDLSAGGYFGQIGFQTLGDTFGNHGRWLILPAFTAVLLVGYSSQISELSPQANALLVSLKKHVSFKDLFSSTITAIRNQIPEKQRPPLEQPVLREVPVEIEEKQLSKKVPEELFPIERIELEKENKTDAKANYSKPKSTSVFEKQNYSKALSPELRREYEAIAELLVKTLEEFGIQGKVISFQPGPVVTVFEFEMRAGIKQAKVVGLCDDIALALKVDSILIQPVKGKRALGIQVPNRVREVVLMGEIVNSSEFKTSDSPLSFAIGKSISGMPVCTDLTSMPHLLIAGATGAGKSVGINTLICSVLMKADPDEVRMILVDPKMLELSMYGSLPHLLMPVITDAERASAALKWAVNEMERRYAIMQQAQIRNVKSFNEKWETLSFSDRQKLKEETGIEDLDKLPYILVVIDELADLMLSAAKEVETNIQRLAQKARASGIHMVLATQRPSVDIITGVIKANLPSRIAFQVVSKHDSRTILDQIGAERLLGKGDMLFQKPGFQKLMRIQGAYMSDEEVERLVSEASKGQPTNYDEEAMSWIEQNSGPAAGTGASAKAGTEIDAKWDEAIEIASSQGFVSASFLQRQLKLGYNRAARIVEHMEKQGLVEKANGSKPRKWLGSIFEA